jgi:uncharacterized Zn-finger protein
MRKKLNIEFIREEFAKEDYTLLTKAYKNAHQKLEYICSSPEKHKHFVSWSNWNSSKKVRCPYCAGQGKPTIEFIRAEFAKENYILLTKAYENSKQKLEYICKRGHRHSITWSQWNSKRKPRCPYCANNAKLNIEFIRAEFAKESYTLLTTVYENAHQKLDYICPRKHRRFMEWSNWQQGQRCPCFSNLMKSNIEFIRAEFAKEGYVLLTTIYENSQQKLKYICPMGHKHYVRWADWNSKKKRRCPYCVGNAKLNIEFIRADFKKEGYTLLTKIYKNAHQTLKYECPIGHVHSVTWSNWNSNKRRCPFCNNTGVSKWEKAVKKFLGESNIDYASNDRIQLINPNTGYNLELDIWFPNLNKAIECNGVYWHKKKKQNDKIKQQLCKQQGIDLLVITDKEWDDDIENCKTKLIRFVGIGT